MTRTSLLVPALLALFAAGVVSAQGPNITFPIAELGGCESKGECKAYCDVPGNAERCLAFAEANGLMNRAEAALARKLAGQTGPGGCRGSECRNYCADPAHHEACMAFAREQGFAPPDVRPEIDEPRIDERRAMQIVEAEGGPGGCRTKAECHAFCEAEDKMEQCLAFATEHGLMSPQDLNRARRMMQEGGPGGCRGMQCKAYCESPDHAEECLAFAEKQGLMKPEDAAKARKMMSVVGPAGCRGIECKQYCENPAHREACMEFALQNGLMSPEDAARMRAFMQKRGPVGGEDVFPGEYGGPEEGRFGGPGGCRTKEECMRYCSEHPDECRGMPPGGQGFGTPPGEGYEFGQPARPNDFGRSGGERAMDMRGFEIPPGMPCTSPEECHALFEQNPEQFKGFMMEGGPGHIEGTGPYHPPDMQSREQYPQQFEMQYQQQYQQYEGMDGQYHQEQPDGYYPPPDGTHYEEPPPSEPASEPTSRLRTSSFVAAVFSIVAQLLGL